MAEFHYPRFGISDQQTLNKTPRNLDESENYNDFSIRRSDEQINIFGKFEKSTIVIKNYIESDEPTGTDKVDVTFSELDLDGLEVDSGCFSFGEGNGKCVGKPIILKEKESNLDLFHFMFIINSAKKLFIMECSIKTPKCQIIKKKTLDFEVAEFTQMRAKNEYFFRSIREKNSD